MPDGKKTLVDIHDGLQATKRSWDVSKRMTAIKEAVSWLESNDKPIPLPVTPVKEATLKIFGLDHNPSGMIGAWQNHDPSPRASTTDDINESVDPTTFVDGRRRIVSEKGVSPPPAKIEAIK